MVENFPQYLNQIYTKITEVLTFGNMPSINVVRNIRPVLCHVFAHLGVPVSDKLKHTHFLLVEAF